MKYLMFVFGLALLIPSPDLWGQSALVIAGGGSLPAEVTDTFIELAGGVKSRVVIIPTASQSADRNDPIRVEELWKSRGVGSVSSLHTRSRVEADTDAFVAPLRSATGVWFGGGSQSRITEAYLGTRVEAELNALLKRGGVIGGSSAGAAIMSQVMITGGNPEAKTEKGFGFLPYAVVDQHFLRRNRVNRLLGVLHQHTTSVGVGIDEGTALIRMGDKLRVVGDSYVTILIPQTDGLPVRIEVLRSGDQARLSEWAPKTVDH
ncbi:MAG: cyanophycinase [Mariniblastus sp.]|nr:cyanophycinase [Mariniblastus sp.]